MRQDAKAVVDAIEERKERVDTAGDERPRLTGLQQIDSVADGEQARRFLLADGRRWALAVSAPGPSALAAMFADRGVEDERGDVDGTKREELLEIFLGWRAAGRIAAQHDADSIVRLRPYGRPDASSASRETATAYWLVTSSRRSFSGAIQLVGSNRSTAAAQRAAHWLTSKVRTGPTPVDPARSMAAKRSTLVRRERRRRVR